MFDSTTHRLVPTDAIDRDTIVEQLGNGQVYQAEKIIFEWILILNDESKVRGLPDTGQVAIDRKDGELHVSLLAQDLRPKRYPPVELVERLSDFCGITNPSHILLLSYILRQDDTDAIEEELRARELMARDLVSDPPSEQIDVESDLSRSTLGKSTEEHAADKPDHLSRDGPHESNTHGANGIHVDTEVQSEAVGGSAGDNHGPSGDIIGESTKSDSQGDTTHHEAKSTTLIKRSGKLKSMDEHRPVNEDQSDSNIVDFGDTLPTKRQTPVSRSSNFSAGGRRTRNASTEALLPTANLNHNEFLNSFEPTSTRTFRSMRDGLVPLSTPLASFGGGDDKQTQYIGERYVGIFTSALRFARR